jgi:hypothetical protein
METTKILFLLIFTLAFSLNSFADDNPPANLKTYTKADIQKIAEKFVNNNLKINDPAIVDVNGDDKFDILNFTDEGNVEYYKNTGTNEEPVFVLENANYGEVGSYNAFFNGMPVPVFFADSDGDNDMDLFAIMDKEFDVKSGTTNYDVQELENSMALDHYTLITIILILAILVLLIIIIK